MNCGLSSGRPRPSPSSFLRRPARLRLGLRPRRRRPSAFGLARLRGFFFGLGRLRLRRCRSASTASIGLRLGGVDRRRSTGTSSAAAAVIDDAGAEVVVLDRRAAAASAAASGSARRAAERRAVGGGWTRRRRRGVLDEPAPKSGSSATSSGAAVDDLRGLDHLLGGGRLGRGLLGEPGGELVELSCTAAGGAAGCGSSHEVMGCGAIAARDRVRVRGLRARRDPPPPPPPAAAVLAVHLGFVLGQVVLREQVLVVRRVHVRDVQEPVAADAEVHERGLDARLDVDDPALVDVPDVALLAGPLDVEFFQHAVLDDRDPALLRLEDVDQHFFLHRITLCRVMAWSAIRTTGPAGRRTPRRPRRVTFLTPIAPVAVARPRRGRIQRECCRPGRPAGRPPGPGSASRRVARRSVRSSTAPGSGRSARSSSFSSSSARAVPVWVTQRSSRSSRPRRRTPPVGEGRCPVRVTHRGRGLAGRGRRSATAKYGRMFSRFGLGPQAVDPHLRSAPAVRAQRAAAASTRSGGSGESVDDAPRAWRSPSSGTTDTRVNDSPAGACALSRASTSSASQVAREFELDDLVAADDAERQGEGEDDAGRGVEAGGGLEREVGAAEHALRGTASGRGGESNRRMPVLAKRKRSLSPIIDPASPEFRVPSCRFEAGNPEGP